MAMSPKQISNDSGNTTECVFNFPYKRWKKNDSIPDTQHTTLLHTYRYTYVTLKIKHTDKDIYFDLRCGCRMKIENEMKKEIEMK